MGESDKNNWVKQEGCIKCLEEIVQGFLDRKEKTSDEVETIMANVPAMWEPMNDPEDSRRATGVEKCSKHMYELFRFDRYVSS